MFARELEPELMDTAEEAQAYDAMDHGDVNTRFCEDLLAVEPAPLRVLDVGTGTARIPIELCGTSKGTEVLAIDLAENMLIVARRNVARAGLADRVRVERIDAKAMPFEDGCFSLVMSNSIVHHIPEPGGVLREMWRVTARGGRLFVRDLVRPNGSSEVDAFVERYVGPDTGRPGHELARLSFRASLCAALSLDELRELLVPLGIPETAVTMTSDRHWTLSFRKP